MPRHDPEIRTCRDCPSQYDLARQDYYGPLCPECNAADDGGA